MSKIFNVGVNPAGLAITNDGKYVLVANNNNYDIPSEETVSMVHVNKNRVKTIHHSMSHILSQFIIQ